MAVLQQEEFEQLTMEQVQQLDPANREDYLALRRMFDGKGWKVFMSWLQAQTNLATVNQLAAADWDHVNLFKGQASAYLTTTNIEKIVEGTYLRVLEDQLEEQNKVVDNPLEA